MSIRDNRKIMSETGHSTDDPEAHQGKRGGTAVHFFSFTILKPNVTQGVTDVVTVFPIKAGAYLNGITLIRVGIETKPTSSYSVNFERWASPTDPAPDTIATVATVTGTLAETDTLSVTSIPVGSRIMVDLPVTDIKELVVWGDFTID